MNFTRTGSFQFKRHSNPTGGDDNYLTEFTNMAATEPTQIPAEQDLAKNNPRNDDKPVTPSRIHVKTNNRHRDKSPVSKEDLLLKHKYSGKIKYVNLDCSEYSSKFVVVDKETETAETLVKKIFNDSSKGWFKHQMPKLIISVTGSAQNFQMKPNLKTVFRRGIAQAAKSTSAWILTGGTYRAFGKL